MFQNNTSNKEPKMNLSQEINDFIENHEYKDFSKINFGTIVYNISREYDLRCQSEEECIKAVDDLKETWVKYEYIQETVSASSLLFHLQMTAQNLEEVDAVISDRFEIFEKTVVIDNCFQNRLSVKYYRTPAYCTKRHYIEVVLLTVEDKIKKILNVEKGWL